MHEPWLVCMQWEGNAMMPSCIICKPAAQFTKSLVLSLDNRDFESMNDVISLLTLNYIHLLGRDFSGLII